MLRLSKSKGPDIELYDKRIKQRGYIVFDKERASRLLFYEECQKTAAFNLALDEAQYKGRFAYTDITNRGVLMRYLINAERCPERYFYTRGREGFTVSQKDALVPLRANGYAPEFLDYYMGFKSRTTKCGKMRNVIQVCSDKAGKNRYGKDVYKIPYHVEVQRNLRYNYRDIDVIGIPREYSTSISVEDGYVLAWGDAAQSDFRIAYNLMLRDETNVEDMLKYEDKYEALARLIAKANGREFDLEVFKEQRPVYKRMTLAVIYGTRGSQIPEESQFINDFVKFLGTCKRYVQFEKSLDDFIDIGIPIEVESYFGHSELCPVTSNREDTIHQALNSPIQTCTAEIIMLTVNYVLDTFYSLGYTEEDIQVYYVRHDEPIFRMKESVMKDVWVFQQIHDILVDDWIPFRFDFFFGYYYKTPDDALMDQYQKAKDDSRITPCDVYNGEPILYRPIQMVLQLEYSAIQIGEKILVVLYCEDLNKADYHLVDTTDMDDAMRYAQRVCLRNGKKLGDMGYRAVQVTGMGLAGDSFENIYFKWKPGVAKKAIILGRYQALRYSKKMGIAWDGTPPLNSDEPFVKSVEVLGYVV